MSQPCNIDNDRSSITWQASLPLLSSYVIIKQLFMVFFLSTACVFIFLVFLELIEGQLTLVSTGRYLVVLSLILVGLLLLSIISMLAFYGNRYEVQFTVNHIGVQSTTVGKTKRKNTLINTLLALSGKPGPAGSGLLAASRQSELIQWKRIDHYNADPKKQEIHLYHGKQALMLVRCTSENYPDVLQWIHQSVPHQQNQFFKN